MTMLGPGRFDAADQKRNIWRVTPEGGTPLDEVTDPGYWTRYINKLNIYDEIEVINEEGAYFARLMVLQKGITTAVVKVLENHTLITEVEIPKEVSDRYEYKWRGPKGHSILDKKNNNTVVLEEMESKEAAIAWIEEHMKMAAQAVA